MCSSDLDGKSATGVAIQPKNTHLDDLSDGTLSGEKIGTNINASNVTKGTLPKSVIPILTQGNIDIPATSLSADEVTNIKAGRTADGVARQQSHTHLTDLSEGRVNGKHIQSGVDAANITTGSLNLDRLPAIPLSKVSDNGDMAYQNKNNVDITGGNIKNISSLIVEDLTYETITQKGESKQITFDKPIVAEQPKAKVTLTATVDFNSEWNNSTDRVIPWNTADFQTGDIHRIPEPGRIYAPIKGLYIFSLKINLEYYHKSFSKDSTPSTFYVKRYLENGTLIETPYSFEVGEGIPKHLNGIISMDEGDYVHIEVSAPFSNRTTKVHRDSYIVWSLIP